MTDHDTMRFFCNKCGYVGSEQVHKGCNYLAIDSEQADADNGVCQYVPTLREKIGWKLFPRRNFLETPALPGKTRDCFIVRCVVTYSFIERLKIMFLGGRTEFEAKVATQFTIGRHMANSHALVVPPKCLCRKEGS